jgi:RNA polymerase sigma-70 factor (ECF subfamily)
VLADATATGLAAPAANGRDAAPSYPLTGRIARGDEAAFAAFYETWFERLLAFARAATRRDEAFCLDAVQDCMLRVVQRLPALPSEEAVAAWLARALLRVAVDRLRAEARRARREDAAAQAASPAADDSLLAAEERAWLRARLDELPERDRALLRARFGEGMTLAAAGAACGVTGDAAHGRIRRLLQKLEAAAKRAFDA